MQFIWRLIYHVASVQVFAFLSREREGYNARTTAVFWGGGNARDSLSEMPQGDPSARESHWA